MDRIIKLWRICRIAVETTMLAILLLASAASAAPVEEWNRTFGGNMDDGALSVKQTSDGGYIVAGYKGYYDPLPYGDSYAWLIKLNSYGIQQWNRTFQVGIQENFATSVQETADGGYIITAYEEWVMSFIGGYRGGVIKTDSSGIEKWNRTYDSIKLKSVQKSSDGGYVITGGRYDTNRWWTDPHYALLIKISSTGDELWNRTFGGSSPDDEDFNSVDIALDGGYILAGYKGADAWLVKADSNGNELWNRTFDGKGFYDVANSVHATPDGGFIIAGCMDTYPNPYVDSKDMLLIKTDSNGNKLWNRTFGVSGGNCANSVDVTSDGGYIIAGYANMSGSRDAWLIRTDPNGNMLWNKTFGGTNMDEFSSIQQVSNGNYIAAGLINYSFAAQSSDAWLIKVSGEADTVPPSSVTALRNRSYAQNYINWTWLDPSEADFDKVSVYIDGIFRANVTKGKKFYKATGLLPGTRHKISTRTVDASGNINQTWVNHTARTKPDGLPPRSITNLTNRSYAKNYINWTWRDPPDADFSYIKVYIDGNFRTNVAKGRKFYNATGFLPNTSHKISTRTVDTSGNINKTWANHTARTARDTAPPASIRNLRNVSYAQKYINWTWIDSADTDFSRVMIYINGKFKTNISMGVKYYNSSNLTLNTSYKISTHTVDTSGNINQTWVNHTARTAP